MKKVTPRLLVFAATLVLALFPMHGQGQSKNKKNDNKNEYNNAARDQPRQAAPASPRVSSPRAQPQPRVVAPQQAAARGPVASTPKPAEGKSDNRPNDKIHTENDRTKVAPKPSTSSSRAVPRAIPA